MSRLLSGVLVLIALTACSSSGATAETQVTIQSAEGRPRSTELLLVINSCNRGPRADVEETTDTVRITVVAAKATNGNDCADLVRVTLAAPLGDRDVFDVVAGSDVTLRRSPG